MLCSRRATNDLHTILVTSGHSASHIMLQARHNEISVVDLKKLEGEHPPDGERLMVASKELDVCEIYPQAALV